jgi:hypothetical protein
MNSSSPATTSASSRRPRTLALRAAALVLTAATIVVGCSASEDPQEVDTAEPTDNLDEAVSAGSVAAAVSNSCSTSSVKGLSLQIIAEGNCIEPGAFAAVPSRPNLSASSNVNLFLEKPARDALVAALNAKPGTTLTVNSMLRTVAQQYLLYRWGQAGSCGIGLAAKPGNSNHETGLALDINSYSTWKSALTAQGFKWFGDADKVHFDYVGAGAVSHKGLDVLAFQKLWNRNHPEDKISADGDWGPQTEARMKIAPAAGFPVGAQCGQRVMCEAVFTDICDSPYLADIEWLVAKGLTSGCDAGADLYCPAEDVTRGQVAAMLAAGLDLPDGPDKFTDDEGSPFEDAINAVAAAGITGGCNTDGTEFCPDAPMTRAEVASFLSKAFNLPAGPDAFTDDDGSIHEDAINAVAAAGISSGCDAAKQLYCPDGVVSREQIASFLHRAFE